MKKAFSSLTASLQRTLGSGLGGRQRRLRVCETLSLGEKRFVAVLRVDDREYLIGGSSASVSLLAALSSEQRPAELIDFADASYVRDK
jgi:flagellar biogenesis protein FliO